MSQKMKQIAENTAEEAEIYVETQQILNEVEENFEKEAMEVVDEARVLTQAENSLEEPFEEKPFVPDKKNRELFDEIDALVQAQNDVANGFEKADAHQLKHFYEKDDADEWNPGAVIDERIKEEQKEQTEEDLRNEIAQSFE